MAYNPSNGDMYEMNEISIGLIEKLIENKNGYTILREFCEEYKVEENVIIEDLSPLLERLVKLELLKVFD